MCEMVGAVDARALGEHVAHLTAAELRNVDDALLLVLDLGCMRFSSGLQRLSGDRQPHRRSEV